MAPWPPKSAEMLREGHPPRAPRRIRQIREYVAAHLSEPLTPPDLARAAGVGVRTLNAEFRAHRGTTPMSWLLAPAPGTRVADAALHWGFMHLGRFAAMYRVRYGESPRQTLER